jgi:hypothetical protein
MAVMTLESLVLCGVRVNTGVKTSMVREGSKQAHVQTPASLSHPRHLSPSGQADYQADSRLVLRALTQPGSPKAAIQAGRSVSFASVPVSPAVMAGRTIRMRWSLAEGGPCSTAAWCFGCLARTQASEANEPLARLAFSRFEADGGIKQMPLMKPACGKTRLAWPTPGAHATRLASAMPSASTRGA